jgi:hypothetical protein
LDALFEETLPVDESVSDSDPEAEDDPLNSSLVLLAMLCTADGASTCFGHVSMVLALDGFGSVSSSEGAFPTEELMDALRRLLRDLSSSTLSRCFGNAE